MSSDKIIPTYFFFTTKPNDPKETQYSKRKSPNTVYDSTCTLITANQEQNDRIYNYFLC